MSWSHAKHSKNSRNKHKHSGVGDWKRWCSHLPVASSYPHPYHRCGRVYVALQFCQSSTAHVGYLKFRLSSVSVWLTAKPSFFSVSSALWFSLTCVFPLEYPSHVSTHVASMARWFLVFMGQFRGMARRRLRHDKWLPTSRWASLGSSGTHNPSSDQLLTASAT